jgi:hypothetical protein
MRRGTSCRTCCLSRRDDARVGLRGGAGIYPGPQPWKACHMWQVVDVSRVTAMRVVACKAVTYKEDTLNR